MWILLLFLCGTLCQAAERPQPAYAILPLTDVWSHVLTAADTSVDNLRETQLQYGEKVLIRETKGDWVRIEAVEQPEFTHSHHWEGYPGWAMKSQFAKTAPARSPRKRGDILTFAKSQIGIPYLWGGLSPAGLDCSGLVHLAFRGHGKMIPRDAADQWLKAKHIPRKKLKPGDLIFSAKSAEPKKITHVAIYEGSVAPAGSEQALNDKKEDMIIEAPQAGLNVREIDFKSKYGKALSDVESGNVVGERVVFFGSFQP